MRLGATLMSGPSMRRLSTTLCAAFILAALPSHAATIRRVSHTATLLTTGDVLITGGIDELGNSLLSADIVATSRGRAVTVISSMGVKRSSHTATLMTNGCVLIAGGNSAATDAVLPVPEITAEIYNPATGLFTPTGSMTAGTARYNHTSTLLNDGRVLICGGQDNGGNALFSCNLYTPTSCTAGAFTAAAPLLLGRFGHTALLLKDGKVWFAGGANPAITTTGSALTGTPGASRLPSG